MTMRPVIGLTLDSEEPGGYSKFPWYAIRQNYCRAIVRAGGLPFALPHESELVESYLDGLNGVIVTGGAFDVDPTLFGARERHATVKLKEGRTDFELAMVQRALERDLPVLGICGGQQLLNVALGGTLVQHIPDEIDGALAHEQPNPRDEVGHEVSIVPDTLLARICGEASIAVNSAHHQAAAEVGPGVVVNAYAPDGVIEGIEAPKFAFCLGVQWHPEFEISQADERIFAAFVEAAGRHRGK